MGKHAAAMVRRPKKPAVVPVDLGRSQAADEIKAAAAPRTRYASPCSANPAQGVPRAIDQKDPPPIGSPLRYVINECTTLAPSARMKGAIPTPAVMKVRASTVAVGVMRRPAI